MFLNLASVRSSEDLALLVRSAAWPVNEQEKENLFSAIERACRACFVGETDAGRDRILRVMLPLLMWGTFNVAYTDLLVRRFRSSRTPFIYSTPSHDDYFSRFVHGAAFDARIVRSHLTKYANPRNWLLHAPRRLRTARSSAFLLTTNITVEKYIAMQRIAVARSFVDDWLPPFIRGSASRTRFPSFVQDLFNALWASIESVQPSEIVAEWLRSFLADGINCIAFYFDALARSERVRRTRELYTATQGYIGTRLISQAVMERGGKVLAFPHAGGLMYVVPHTWMVETLTCSQFSCYSTFEQSVRDEQLRLLGGKRTATLHVLSGIRGGTSVPRDQSGTIRRVLYLGAGYPGDRFFVDVLPEVIRLTLEVRIIDALVRRGLEVTVKCHRKSRLIDHLMTLLSARYGNAVTIDTTPLTDLIRAGDLYDAYVTENLGGGSLIEILKTGRPVVLISPHLHFLHESMRDDFLRRVNYIPCTFDERGAPTFDTRALDTALHQRVRSTDNALVDRCTHASFEY